jgi:hypothetical protein
MLWMAIRKDGDEEDTYISGFLLCLLSPVWRAKYCRGLSASARRKLELEVIHVSFATYRLLCPSESF